MDPNIIREEEIEQLLAGLLDLYGYDFTNYARASLRRRINRIMIVDKLPSFAELFYKIKSDPAYLKHFVAEVTVNVTEMFRDPQVYATIRREVLPVLATYPFIRIWHAGCATGEEVYSMAILLEESGLLHKSLLYATDLNHNMVEQVRSGIFPMRHMKQYSENYIAAGGKQDFSQYYTAKYDRAVFSSTLRKKLIVATHNLVSDSSFNEFQMIFCRNVLIYFDKTLQEKVLQLLDNSLEQRGFLVLGTKENLRFSAIAPGYLPLAPKDKIWRKRQ
ncbi:MCP methyltransferase, CheR-type [Cnuella takakiae]|uniref:MCP methyltransferase, CheR-type n=1 Tax=Cnuella takakiae TaxID=1302690 RepID=A0A1M5BW15_9BACT|nr:protein-glutamate O-methyltransferase CheR [Cnuella takakiae]OLY93535.1 chemotaxis protein CheR [Cnuella takakiae]SHF46635.1 MCP methyltransferase, CheR-type [Cnuella takakiae]